MKFKMIKSLVYWWPVTVRLPDPGKPGAMLEQKFEAQFEAVNEVEAKQLDDEFAALETDAEKRAHQHDFLRRVVKDWRGVEDDVPFSTDVFEAAIAWPQVRTGLYDAYYQSVSGQEARTKN